MRAPAELSRLRRRSIGPGRSGSYAHDHRELFPPASRDATSTGPRMPAPGHGRPSAPDGGASRDQGPRTGDRRGGRKQLRATESSGAIAKAALALSADYAALIRPTAYGPFANSANRSAN